MEHIKTIFDRLNEESFSSEKKEILGVDLNLIDGKTRKIISHFIDSKGHLTTDEIETLNNCFVDLKAVVPQLDRNERQYFATLKQLAKDTIEIAKDGKLSNNEIAQRHKWKKVYNQIKDIVNVLDPLGVADTVDDEYDDLNFKIYSQLLVDREDSKVLNTIKTKLKDYYGISLQDIDLNETVQKLKSISLDNRI